MSEPKETESGTEAQAEGLSEPREADASSDDAESSAGAKVAEADEATDAAEGAAAEPAEAPKKKKKRAREQEPETIKDRNARVRAEAAEKRRSKRDREQGTAPRRNLDASEVMDDALARSTHAAAGFLSKHFNKVQWVIMAGLAGWIGYEVYAWRHEKNTQKNTEALFTALAAETGKVGTATPDPADEGGLPEDGRSTFATDEERLKAAKSAYVLASSSTGSVIADLGVAGTAYDLGQYKEAQTSYEKVQQSALYAKDNDVKGRTLEGLAMSLEAQKNDDGALKAFRELSNMDSANFAALGLYHQARILKQQGKNDDALKLLEKAGDKLATLKETPAVIRYVGRNVLELLESLDAKKAKELSDKLISAEAKKQQEAAAKMPGMQNLSPDMQRKLQEMMDKMQKEAPPAPTGDSAPAPGPVLPGPVQDAPAPSEAP
ncbi:MAG: tetratricopeptide repeat protein [Myxococcales bacterium]|nr:MAG: tetratricopeptide repeat protein [Myxococcales bacterium]